jgi:hypothetical protein
MGCFRLRSAFERHEGSGVASLVDSASHSDHVFVSKGREGGGMGKRFFAILLGLAGLGVGIWLFRSKRRSRER